LVDIEYYGFFGDHLGVWLWSYFDSFGPVLYSVFVLYPVFQYLIGWIVLTAIFIFIARKFNRILKVRPQVNIINRIGYLVVVVIFLIISIRGGTSLAPIDWGMAYHSNNFFANELSLNGIYTLVRNIYEYNDDTGRHNPDKYHFFDDADALTKVQNVLLSPRDSLVEPDLSLKRLSNFDNKTTASQNVVFIVLESWSAKYVGAYGGTPSATPFFDELAEKSLFFENFYASGLRTNRGLLSVLCSFPSLPGRTVMKLYGSAHPFMSITEVVEGRNYDSFFIYGGDLDFDNMGGFFRMKGYEHFIGINDFPYNDRLNKWGVPDHLALEKANEVFAATYPQPFVAVVVTLSNHEPFVLPDEKYKIFGSDVKYHDYLNTFYYSDCSLRYFFELASQEEYFNNTIFVLVSDHGKILGDPNDLIGIFKIASLIYTPGRDDIKPRHITTVAGQVDLLPTVLHLLGEPVTHESWGRDILGLPDDDPGYAFVNRDDSYGWIADSLMLWEKVGAKSELFDISVNPIKYDDISPKHPQKAGAMKDKGRAMLQLEVDLVHSDKRIPPE
jgi:phosphoglycerol transferase MdoB-like AlkP superfamily enzyme